MRIPAMVPRFDTRGLLSVSILLGCLYGIVATFGFTPLMSWLTSRETSGSLDRWAVLSFIALLMPFVIPPVFWGAVLSLLTSRRRMVFVSGALAYFSFGMTVFVLGLSMSREYVPALSLWQVLLMLAWQAGSAAFAGAFVLLSHQASRGLIFRVFEGSPTTCRKCAYDAATDLATVCPECGTLIEPGRYRFRLLHGLADRTRSRARGLRVTVAIVAAAALVLMGSLFVAPPSAFVRQFRDKGEIVGAPIYARGKWPHSPASGVGVVLRTSPGSAKVVWVGYLAKDQEGFPAMQLQLHTEQPSIGFGLGKTYMSAGPPIFSVLDRAQAEWVVANGVPQSLMDAMVAAENAIPGVGGSAPIYVEASPHLGGKGEK